MDEMMSIDSLELIRRIRDAQAQALAGKPNTEILAFFARAGERARQYARQHAAVGAREALVEAGH